MPSHIYWRVGRYEDAAEINQRAIEADQQFFSWCRAGAFYSAAYYPHNVHFLWAAAAAEGRRDIALSAARKLAAVTTHRVEEFYFLEEFVAIPSLTLARFGQWDALLGERRPDESRRYLTGIWHYTRGLALARTGDLPAASEQLKALHTVIEEPVTTELILAGGTSPASRLLQIGAEHLSGEIAAERDEWDEAVRALQAAVVLQDGLAYMEPPPWYFPVRQALGAVLLDAGRPAEAEAVYRADLDQYPGTGWSLFGLARSLRAQGQDAEAEWAEQGFGHAWARADVELQASRF
jgi:tetratricopeptide (TPR) repeat protein